MPAPTAGRLNRREVTAVLHHVTPRLRSLILRALRAHHAAAAHRLLHLRGGGPAPVNGAAAPAATGAAGPDAGPPAAGGGGAQARAARCGGGGGSGAEEHGAASRRDRDDDAAEAERPRKRPRALGGAAVEVQDIDSGSDGEAVFFDSDGSGGSQRGDGAGDASGPDAEPPGPPARGRAGGDGSQASPRAAELEAGACPSLAGPGDGLGGDLGGGGGGGSEWPLGSGPGLWEDQEEWGFLGVTFDPETQVGVLAQLRQFLITYL
jgi:hypothetical protein